jgi:hypothetical protein
MEQRRNTMMAEKKEKRGKGRPPSDEPPRVLRAVKVPADLDERLNNAKAWCQFESISEIILNGLEAELTRLERKHNDGKPFPPPEPKR